MITGHNNVFNLLSRGMVSPMGWGFPPTTEYIGALSPLRKVLMFLEDDDGKAQLLRWYAGVIRSFNPVWRSISGESEGYMPSMFHKPCFQSNTLGLKRNTVTGSMSLGWVPGPEIKSLSAKLNADAPEVLHFEDYQVPVQLQYDTEADLHNLLLPEKMKAQLAISGLELSTEHIIQFRPVAFNAAGIASEIEILGLDYVDQAGLLDTFFALPRPEDKLAVAWLAISLLEKLP